MTTGHRPTMDGFEWSPTTPFVPTEPGEDGWCGRDAFCELFGWEPDSDEWSRFISAPGRLLIDRLTVDAVADDMLRIDVRTCCAVE